MNSRSAAWIGVVAAAFAAFVVLGVMGGTARAQQVIFSENFENGAPGWTATGTPQILWHVAEPGECGSVTRTAVYNRGPAVCNYNTSGTANEGRFSSPPILMSGSPTFFASFDCMRLMDASGDGASLRIVDLSDPGDTGIVVAFINSQQSSPVRIEAFVPSSSYYANRTVRFDFVVITSPSGNNNVGLFIDNFTVTNSSCNPVTISSHPGSLAIIPGFDADFSVAAQGTAPFSYRWRRGGVDLVNEAGRISGATTATLRVSNAVVADTGTYDCVVSNACGSVTSNPGVLYVREPVPQVLFSEDFETGAPGWTAEGLPIIMWHVAEPGECGSVTRMAAYNRGPAMCSYSPGTGEASYGYYYSPPVVMSGTASPFRISFDYIKVMDVSGDVASILIQDVGNPQLETMIIFVSGSTGVPLHVSGYPIPASDFWAGRTVRFKLSVATNPLGNQGAGFFVDNLVVTNSCGPTIISAHPLSQSLCSGEPAVLSVSAMGDPPLTYQWRRNSVNLADEPGRISGSNSPTLSLANTSAADAGVYDCIISNACGNVPSNTATLTAEPPLPAVISGPHFNPATGHAYYVLPPMSWTDAQAAAARLGGHLATINDAAENQWIAANLANPNGADRNLWIGLNDIAAEGNYVWVSGQSSSFTSWLAGEPSNTGGGEHVVHMYSNGLWNDAQDSATPSGITPAFAAVEVNAPAVVVGPVRNPANGHDYYLLNTSSWLEAHAAGLALGGNLVTIDDAGENEWVRANMATYQGSAVRIWIGLNDRACEGEFAWADGSAGVYRNFLSGEPSASNAGEDFVEMYPTGPFAGQWNDNANVPGDGADYGLVEVVPPPPACACDWNDDGAVGSQDFFDFITSFFGGEADINGDGMTGSQDFFDFLTCFFSPPVGCA